MSGSGGPLADEVQAYIDAILPERRPLFDRVHGLVLAEFPDVDVLLSYKMPTYVVGRFRLYVASWRHGLSFYGWKPGRDGGLTERHPELVSGRGTLKLGFRAAEQIPDDEIRAFVRAVLGR